MSDLLQDEEFCIEWIVIIIWAVKSCSKGININFVLLWLENCIVNLVFEGEGDDVWGPLQAELL